MKSCVDMMLTSNKTAARVVSEYILNRGIPIPGYRCCCTDVTGFGLLGHLIEMLKYNDPVIESAEEAVSSSCGDGYETDEGGSIPTEYGVKSLTTDTTVLPGAVLHLDKLPILPGALECIEQGTN